MTRAGSVPVSYAALAIAYLLVAAGVVWILRRLAAAPLDGPGDPQDTERPRRQLAGA